MVPQVPAENSGVLEEVNPQGFYAAFGGGVGSFGANLLFSTPKIQRYGSTVVQALVTRTCPESRKRSHTVNF